MDPRERPFRIMTGIIYDLLRQITFPEETPRDIRDQLVQSWQEQIGTATEQREKEVVEEDIIRQSTSGRHGPETQDADDREITSEEIPNWPVLSSREASPVETTRDEGNQNNGRICIRCLKGWRTHVQAEDPVPECIFVKGNGRYKCDDCSRMRVPCDMVPGRLTAKLLLRKLEMEELEKESRDSKDSREARQRFSDTYQETVRELQSSKQVAEKLKRETRKRCREELNDAGTLEPIKRPKNPGGQIDEPVYRE